MIADGKMDSIKGIARRMVLMKKLIGLFAFLALSAAPLMAQSYPRFDFSVGGSMRSFQQSETATGITIGMPGWYGAIDYNFHRFRNHFALELQAAGNYRDQGYFGRTSVYTYLVGPKIYPLGHHKLTPYGHVLIGGAYNRNDVPPEVGGVSTIQSSASNAWETGLGLDWNIKKHWGVRLLEFDYGQTRFFQYKTIQTNYVASIGINYRFGR
jgi:opacity protein-like surface antigen